jgi:fumarate reductase flavoprotein subunit
VDVLEQAVEKGYAVKADTLEELAEALELTDVDAFVDTINTYNSDAASGQDDSVFGVANAAMAPVTVAPYYAVKIKAVSSFSLAGLAVDENCKIIKEDGTPIENLYGAGELISGNLTAGYYTGSGTQVGSGLYEGKIIANDILSEQQ